MESMISVEANKTIIRDQADQYSKAFLYSSCVFLNRSGL